MYKLSFEEVEELKIKLPICVGSWRKYGNSRKTSASLTTLKYLNMWITTNWNILQEIGIPDHLTCLLRNLYAGQEATDGTRHGTTDWFQIGKRVHQGYILSSCLFNLYAMYIMWNAGWMKHKICFVFFFFCPETLLLFPWSNKCWQFDLWFLCLF